MAQAGVYVGVDVSRDRLDVSIGPEGEVWQAGNDAAGIREVVERLGELQPERIVVEATGGLERAVAAGLGDAELPVVREPAAGAGLCAGDGAVSEDGHDRRGHVGAVWGGVAASGAGAAGRADARVARVGRTQTAGGEVVDGGAQSSCAGDAVGAPASETAHGSAAAAVGSRGRGTAEDDPGTSGMASAVRGAAQRTGDRTRNRQLARGSPAGVREAEPQTDRRACGGGAPQPGQRQLPGQTQRLGRQSERAHLPLHGHARRNPAQLRDTALLCQALRRRQAQEGGLGCLHA